MRHAVTSGLTRRPAADTSPAAIARRWRGHGTLETRGHAIRDVACGEDAHQAWAGRTPQALAALRNALMSLLRALGWRSSTRARAHYGASLHRALHLLHTHPARL